MPTPVQYAPVPYVRSGNLGELIRQRGRNAAEAEMRAGEIQAQMFGNLGNIISGSLNSYAQQKRDEPMRQMEAERAQIGLENARAEQGERQQLSRQDAAFTGLLEMFPDGNVPPKEVLSIYGPQRGPQIVQGMAALAQLSAGPVKEAREMAGRLAVGAKALSPQMLQQFWPAIRTAAIKGGLGDEQGIPEQATPEYLDAVIGWSTGQAPAQPEAFTLNPGDVRFDGKGNQLAAVPAAERPEPNPTEAALALRAAQGDPQAQQALDLIRQQRPPAREPADPLVAVIGDDGQPVMLPRSQAVGRRPASSREQGRAVTSGDAGRIAELDSSIDDLAVLRQTVLPTDPKTGKVTEFGTTGTAAKVGAMVPNWATELTGWGEDAKSRQAVIDRVKQVIGKALEDGVLRKEDELKYEKILPTIGDPASVVETKLDGLDRAIALRRQRQLDALEDAGYDVAKFRERSAPPPNTVNAAPPAPPGWKYVPKPGGGWTAVEDK